MKRLLLLLGLLSASPGTCLANEDQVTYTVQALSGLAGDSPRFVKVYCHDIYLEPTSKFSLICAPNIPPTNSKRKLSDHNILSTLGIAIQADFSENDPIVDGKLPIEVVLDLTKMIRGSEEGFEHSDENVVRIAFECIRMTGALRNTNYTVSVKGEGELAKIAEKVRTDFAKHDQTKLFVRHPGRE